MHQEAIWRHETARIFLIFIDPHLLWKPFPKQFTVGIRPRLTGIFLMPLLMQTSIIYHASVQKSNILSRMICKNPSLPEYFPSQIVCIVLHSSNKIGWLNRWDEQSKLIGIEAEKHFQQLIAAGKILTLLLFKNIKLLIKFFSILAIQQIEVILQ